MTEYRWCNGCHREARFPTDHKFRLCPDCHTKKNNPQPCGCGCQR